MELVEVNYKYDYNDNDNYDFDYDYSRDFSHTSRGIALFLRKLMRNGDVVRHQPGINGVQQNAAGPAMPPVEVVDIHVEAFVAADFGDNEQQKQENEVPQMLRLVTPTFNDDSIFATAEGGDEELIAEIIDMGCILKSVKRPWRAQFVLLYVLHVLGSCECPQADEWCVHRNVLSREFTPLMIAARVGDVEAVNRQLRGEEGRASINKTSRADMTALHVAACYNHREVVEVLLENGADANMIKPGYTPAAFAAALGYTEIVEVLLDQVLINGSGKWLAKVLRCAAAGGQDDIIELLIARVEDKNLVNDRKRGDYTALMVAARAGHVITVEQLLLLGANCMVQDRHGQTALHWAAEAGHVAVMESIVENVNPLENNIEEGFQGFLRARYKLIARKSDNGCTVIEIAHDIATLNTLFRIAISLELFQHFARLAMQGALVRKWYDLVRHTIEFVKCIIEFGETYSQQDSDNATISLPAEQPNEHPTTELIQDAKHAAEYKTATSMSLRTTKNYAESISSGEKEGDQEMTHLHVSCSEIVDDVLNELLTADKHVAAYLGIRPLHWAASDDDPNVVREFLQKFFQSGKPNNIDLNELDDHFCTALMCCAKKGNVSGFKMLLRNGADPSKAAKGKQTVLFHLIEQYAEQPPLRGNLLKMFDLIKDNQKVFDWRRIECNVPSRELHCENMTALHLAVATGAIEIFKHYSDKFHVHRSGKKSLYAVRFEVEHDNTPGSHDEGIKSCLKQITKFCTEDECVKMLRIEALKVFLTEYSRIRQLMQTFALIVHIIYMICFSVYVVPITRSTECNSTTSDVHFDIKSSFGLFLLWPTLLFGLEAINVIIYAVEVRRRGVSNATKAFMDLFTEGDTPASFYAKAIVLDEYAGNFFSVGFCTIIATWYALYCSLDCGNLSSYATVVMVATIYGWMLTIDYTKCFTGLYAFCLLLKIVFVKDVLRILCIYVFVLVGFSLALSVYINAISSSADYYNMSLSNVFYQVFATIFGLVSVLQDLSTNGESMAEPNSASTIRLLFAIYILLSTVVLMNILIAMMNNTYDEVYGLKETLWCVAGLHSIEWFWYDKMLALQLANSLTYLRLVESAEPYFRESKKYNLPQYWQWRISRKSVKMEYATVIVKDEDDAVVRSAKATIGVRESTKQHLITVRNEISLVKSQQKEVEEMLSRMQTTLSSLGSQCKEADERWNRMEKMLESLTDVVNELSGKRKERN